MLSDETLEEVCRSLDEEIHKGLGKETNKKATIKCFPTFVQELPNGKGNENKQATIKCFPTFVQELPNGKGKGKLLLN